LVITQLIKFKIIWKIELARLRKLPIKYRLLYFQSPLFNYNFCIFYKKIFFVKSCCFDYSPRQFSLVFCLCEHFKALLSFYTWRHSTESLDYYYNISVIASVVCRRSGAISLYGRSRLLRTRVVDTTVLLKQIVPGPD